MNILNSIPKFFRFLIFIARDFRSKGHLYRYIKRAGYDGKGIIYDEDGMFLNKNLSSLNSENIQNAYKRGIYAASGRDFNFRFRVYVLLWAAKQASLLNEGDFVECGTARGFVASAIMNFLDWNQLEGKNFYLFDTFEGIVEELLSPEEKKKISDVSAYNRLMKDTVYADAYEEVVKNFNDWKNVKLVKGQIPSTLSVVNIPSVAFLHIDMNCVAPEIAAINHFWPRLVKGGIVVLDDYGHMGHELQKNAFDDWAAKEKVMILTLPTGQGLFIKP